MKKIVASHQFKDEMEKFGFFVLAGLYGIVFFNFLIWNNFSGDIPGRPDFNLFILGWSSCPAAGVLSVHLLQRFGKKLFGDTVVLYPALIFSNVFFILLYLQPHWGLQVHLKKGWIVALIFGGFQWLGIFLAKRFSAGKIPPGREESLSSSFYQASLYLFIVWLFSVHSFTHILRDFRFPNYLFLGAVIWLFYFFIPFKPGEGGNSGFKGGLVYVLVAALIAYLVIDPYFPYQQYHYSYFMGPLADLINGKSLLADINAQYGVLIFYFLKLFFYVLPFGYTSFSFVVTLLIVLQFCLFFFIARKLFNSWTYSFLCLGTLLLVNHFGSSSRPTLVPSIGPLRFGFAYLLMASILLRNQFQDKKNYFFWFESLLMAVALFWSYEVCFYTLPPYLMFLFFESASFGDGGMSFDAGMAGRRVGRLAVCALVVGGLFYLDVYSRTGGLPHWSYYLDYIFLYKGGFGSMPRPGLDYWCLIAGTLYFSFMAVLAVLFSRGKREAFPQNFNMIVFLTLYGVFQYLYFIYRSHPNNLFHVSMPSIVLFAYWLNYFRTADPPILPRGAKKIVFALAVGFIGIYPQVLFPNAVSRIREQIMAPSDWWKHVSGAALDFPRDDQFAKDAEQLMAKYSGDRKLLPYFFGENGLGSDENIDYDLMVSIYARRSKNYPYNDLSQAGICPPALDRIMNFDPRLKTGDFLYYRPAYKTTVHVIEEPQITFEKKLVEKLFAQYRLGLVEETRGIAVYKVLGIR